MNKFGIICVNNNRSKAYLQNLIRNRFLPSFAFVLNGGGARLVEHEKNDAFTSKFTKQMDLRKIDGLNAVYNEKEHVVSTLEKNDIPYTIFDGVDVNSDEMFNVVKSCDLDTIIFSAPSGNILGKRFFGMQKEFIHVHPGFLPNFKGSTTLYYSYLLDGQLGVSVICLNANLDGGPILYRKLHSLNLRHVDFDHVLDPLIRAEALVEWMNQRSNFHPIKIEQLENNTMFYIIHPVLKHLAVAKSFENSAQ